MATVGSLLSVAAENLKSVAGEDAMSEALMLLAFQTGRQSSVLRANLDDIVDITDQSGFENLIAKRKQHQPISQIIGKRDFWKHEFIVTPDVLDPRPDTETLVEQALTLGPRRSVLDLGTGSGCILLSLLAEWPSSKGVGIDASQAALNVARRNAVALGVVDRCELNHGDWCSGINQTFDLIVTNPPYITSKAMETLSRDVIDWEPRMALTPEGDGLAAYRVIAQNVSALMTPDAKILFEIGFDQGEEVCQILENTGFCNISITQDINGKDRVVQAGRPDIA